MENQRLQKEWEELEAQNAEVQRQIDEGEAKVNERERELYRIRRDVEV